MEFVKVDSIKEEVEEETPLAGVQPAAVWQEEMEQKPVVEMEFVKVDSIKEEVEEETPLAGVQPAPMWQGMIEDAQLVGASNFIRLLKDEGCPVSFYWDNNGKNAVILIDFCSKAVVLKGNIYCSDGIHLNKYGLANLRAAITNKLRL
ncbi:uncharacterized protein LOC134537910 isoform X3 [Bacillus rossius redtenbacheri]